MNAMANANCAGENLLLIGTLIAIQIAQCVDSDGLALLGGLFTVIGDQLALLSITKETPDNDTDDTQQEDSGETSGDTESGGEGKSAGGNASSDSKATPTASRGHARGQAARGCVR